MILCEFYGGPWDGREVWVGEAINAFFVPRSRPAKWECGEEDMTVTRPSVYAYQRTSSRRFDLKVT